MNDTSEPKTLISLTRAELQVLVYAIASSQPLTKELEEIQYRLYHRLLQKLNDAP
jgi:hypothetical protein